MNLEDILKQFKSIEPDAAYRDRSKRVIFASAQIEPWSARRIFLQIIETGAAVAIAVFFVFLVGSSLGGSGLGLSPVQYSAINPESIRAEAQAIDIQIQLANLNYRAGGAESTPAVAPPLAARIRSAAPVLPAADAAATSTGTSTISIEQALEGLSN